MTTNLPPYGLTQSVFLLSLGSNGLFGVVGSQADLQTNIQVFLGGTPETSPGTFFEVVNTPSPSYRCLGNVSDATDQQGDWGTVWGPKVYVAPDNLGATNTMFVAHSPSQNVYVVAIAGTNPLGESALIIQDIDVNPANMAAWPPGVTGIPGGAPQLAWTSAPNPPPTTPAIAKGTSDGLSVLYAMEDPLTGLPLKAFLDNLTDKATSTLIFTGHSLGGALAPALALLLYPNTPLSPNPDATWNNIYILATAGPTPGNQAVANLFTAAYPPAASPSDPAGPSTPAPNPPLAQFTAWNTIYANNYDVVPRAWNALWGLVTPPPHPVLDTWQSFFAGGFEPGGPVLDPLLGATLFDLVASLQTRAGYAANGDPSAESTIYYTPALQHSSFTGEWGSWTWSTDKTSGDYLYPATWIAETPEHLMLSLDELMGWVLNAHLDQYSAAFLGYPGPKNPPQVTHPPTG